MAAPKGHPRYPGAGRKKGTKNKPKPFEQAIASALERYGMEKAGREIVKATMAAMQSEVLLETDAGVIKKQIFNFDGLKAVLPYVASRKADKVEHTGKDGEPLTIRIIPFDAKP